MVKHGSSHGLSVFVCTIISVIFVDLVRPLIPDLFKEFEGVSQKLLSYIPIQISPKYFNILLIASFLGVLWGIFFKLRFDKD